jgi:hypothetical protein
LLFLILTRSYIYPELEFLILRLIQIDIDINSKFIFNKLKKYLIMEYVNLNDGNKIPLVGLGTYKSTKEEGIAPVKAALNQGYSLLDTASVYGNE